MAASPAACTLAMWHRPLFSSGPNENAGSMREMWRLLSQYGADLVLSGHNHMYERFAPQDADGRPDPRGPRQFVVGTGGYPLYGVAHAQANSEVLDSDTWGVLKLTLKSASYAWELVYRSRARASAIPVRAAASLASRQLTRARFTARGRRVLR